MSVWDDYRYEGREGVCRRDDILLQKADSIRSSIEGFVGIEPKNNAALIKALSYGVVAIGLCGNYESFLFYDHGIFDDIECCKDQG